MAWFDSLTHVTHDGSWMGERHCDASLAALLADMRAGDVRRACLVSIAGYVDNEVILASAQAHPDLFVPIAGLNPVQLPTMRRVEAAVATIAKQGFAGIKLHPRLNGYDPLDAEVHRGDRRRREARAGHPARHALPPPRPRDAARAGRHRPRSWRPARRPRSCCCTPPARPCSTCTRSSAPTIT